MQDGDNGIIVDIEDRVQYPPRPLRSILKQGYWTAKKSKPELVELLAAMPKQGDGGPERDAKPKSHAGSKPPIAAYLAKSKSASADGIWRTTEDGSKIFIGSDGTVRAGGPNGPVLTRETNVPSPVSEKSGKLSTDEAEKLYGNDWSPENDEKWRKTQPREVREYRMLQDNGLHGGDDTNMPTGSAVLEMPVAEGIKSENPKRGFGNCDALAYKYHKKQEAEIWTGYAIEKIRYEEAVATHTPLNHGQYGLSAIPHSWNVRDGKIEDHALGSDSAKDHVYIGVKAPDSHIAKVTDPKKAFELQDWASLRKTDSRNSETGLSNTEIADALDDYSGSDGAYREVNAYLRGDRDQVSDRGKKVIESIDKLFKTKAEPTTETTTVYRGVDSDIFRRLGAIPEDYGNEWWTFPGAEIETADLKGKAIIDPAFMSTSTRKDEAKKYNPQTQLRITVPKGTKVIDRGFRYDEAEVLLDRGTKLVITGVKVTRDDEDHWTSVISAKVAKSDGESTKTGTKAKSMPTKSPTSRPQAEQPDEMTEDDDAILDGIWDSIE